MLCRLRRGVSACRLRRAARPEHSRCPAASGQPAATHTHTHTAGCFESSSPESKQHTRVAYPSCLSESYSLLRPPVLIPVSESQPRPARRTAGVTRATWQGGPAPRVPPAPAAPISALSLSLSHTHTLPLPPSPSLPLSALELQCHSPAAAAEEEEEEEEEESRRIAVRCNWRDFLAQDRVDLGPVPPFCNTRLSLLQRLGRVSNLCGPGPSRMGGN